MKKLLLALVLAVVSTSFSYAQTITGSDQGLISQLPGSPTDFVFFGQGQASAYSVLTDFTVNTQPYNQTTGSKAVGGNGTYGGNQYYSTIETPTGFNVLTGLIYLYSAYGPNNGSPNNLVGNLATFTLGTSPTTFNYSDFNVFVLYSNADLDYGTDPSDKSQTRGLSISLAAGNDATGSSATLVPISDTNTNLNEARVVEFNVQGLAAGDEFTIAASPQGGDPAYISGVSFESAPEPSTYAMIAGGLVLLAGVLRLKRTAARA